MSYIGTSKVGSVYLGDTKIGKAYLGTDLVFDSSGGTPVVLPYDAEIEYLQSSGTQYIDTGIKISDNITCEVKAQYTTNNNGFDTILGCYATNPGRYGVFLGLQSSSSGGKLYMEVGHAVNNVSSNITSTAAATSLHTFKSQLSNGTLSLTIDGTANTNTFRGAYPDALNLWLFARNREGTAGNQSKAKVFYCKITKSGNLVFDAIPVRVGQVGYMYDRVSGQLLGNSGSGNFVLGNDVSGGGDEQVTVLDSLDSTTPITFDTGVDITTNHTWEIDSSVNLYSAWATWSSCWDGSAWKTTNSFIVQRSNNTSNLVLYIGNLNGGYQQSFSPGSGRIVQGYDGSKYYCSGYTYNFSPRAYTAPLKVISQHIYGVKIWRNGTLVNNFVPANVDGEVGMYDTKGKRFIKLL